MDSLSFFVAVGTILTTGLAACLTQQNVSGSEEQGDVVSQAVTDTTLVGTSWSLASIDGEAIQEEEGAEVYTLTFGPEGGLSGSADCNQFFGPYTLSDEGELTVEHLGSTKVMCPPESLFDEYLAHLEGGGRLEMEGDQLHLLAGDGTRLTFKPTAVPEGQGEGVPSSPSTTDFRASGNEPFWSLVIREEEGMTFSRPGDDGAEEIRLPYARPSLGIETGERFFHAETEAHELQAIFAPKPCVDDMSGAGFEFTATVTLDGENLFGCAEALN